MAPLLDHSRGVPLMNRRGLAGLLLAGVLLAALLATACTTDSKMAPATTGSESTESSPTIAASATGTSTAAPLPTVSQALSPTPVQLAATFTPIPQPTSIPASPSSSATVAPVPTIAPTAQGQSGPVTFNVSATEISFNVVTLTTRSGATVTVNFTNNDLSITHDVSFNLPGLAHGNTCEGPCTDRYTFVGPAPGNYLFFCTVHEEMVGTFLVTP